MKVLHFATHNSAIHKAKGFEAAGSGGVVPANGSIHGLWEFFCSTGIEPVDVVSPWAL